MAYTFRRAIPAALALALTGLTVPGVAGPATAATNPPATARSVTAADISTWDPAASPTPTTRWFVLPGDRVGAGTLSIEPTTGRGGLGTLILDAPTTADRIAVLTLPPAGLTLAQVGNLDAYPVADAAGTYSAAGSRWPTMVIDLDCNGTASGGRVRARTPGQDGASFGVVLDQDVHSDGTTGAGSASPVLTAGTRYSLSTVAAHCNGVVDYGMEAGRFGSASAGSVLLTSTTGLRRDFFRVSAPGSTAPVRLGGEDRLDTALAVADHQLPASGRVDALVLVGWDAFADAIPGAILARQRAGALLMTRYYRLDPRVSRFLTDHVVPHGTVYLLGGTGVLGPGVQKAVTDLGLTAVRLGGQTRFDTAVTVAKTLAAPDGACSSVAVADGTNFPDALSAAALDAPIVYTAGSTVPAATAAYLRAAQPCRLDAVGGPAAGALARSTFAAKVSRSFVGTDRYATSAKVLGSLSVQYLDPFTGPEYTDASESGLTISVAAGTNFPDALVGAVRSEVLLTRPGQLPDSSARLLTAVAPAVGPVYVLGTADVVSDAVAGQVRQALSKGLVTVWPS